MASTMQRPKALGRPLTERVPESVQLGTRDAAKSEALSVELVGMSPGR
jgi:hypothetical protein